jgi:3-oxoacyl-[acyl-carrier-protein] synthase-1
MIVARTDSLLNGATDGVYRGPVADDSDGTSRRAAAAVLLSQWSEEISSPLMVRGLGFASEPAPRESGKPLRADGLTQAIRAALDEAEMALVECNHRIGDMNGEQYRFKEAALAINRLLRDRKVLFSIWHPCDSIGEVGAATLPAMLTILHLGASGDCLPGPRFLGHLGNDDDKRAAFVTQTSIPQTLSLVQAAEAEFRHGRGIGG